MVPAGDAFRVTLRVLGGTTTHLLKMPSAQGRDSSTGAASRACWTCRSTGRSSPSTCARRGDLYKKLVEATEGYAGDVPIIHQAVAVKAAIDALDAAFQEDRDANF